MVDNPALIKTGSMEDFEAKEEAKVIPSEVPEVSTDTLSFEVT